MSKSITKIQMTGFRGAIGTFELDFAPEKDFTMLFGENGSGKSSILDAIDVVCNSTIGCLDGVSIGQNPGKYLCALGSQANALRVTVNSDAESWTGTMNRNAISVAGAAEKPKVKILRRNKILELVLAQPSDRYRALRHFIDIAVVEQSEGTLKQKIADIDGQINGHVGKKDHMSNQLDNIWVAENRPGQGNTSLAWAEEKITAGIGSLTDRLARLKTVVDALVKLETAQNNYKSRSTAAQTPKQQLEEVEREIEAAPSVSSATAMKLLEALEKAKSYIEIEPTLDKCPTCQRPIERQTLLTTVTQEISQLSGLKTLSEKKRVIQKPLEIAESNMKEAETGLLAALQKVSEVTEDGDIPEVVELGVSWPAWEAEAQDIDVLLAISEKLVSIKETLEQQRDSAQRDVNQFNSIKEWWTGIKEAEEKATELDRIAKGLKAAYKIVHEKKVAFTQGILDSIKDEANRMFQAIHPNENIGLEQLKMVEERRGSVDQSGIFHGHTEIPPQAVFSESHLDTLGFCVWLALAKREGAEHTIIIIDDIFSSVDATHLGRVIDLLSAEAPNFLQVIIATHYRLWWDRCQNAQGIQRIHLGRWCATNGIAAQNMPMVTQQLQELVAQSVFDRQAVSSKAGILLESIMDDLTLLYKCSLPRNKVNLYTLGNFLDASGKLFSKHNLTVQVDDKWNEDCQDENWQETTAKAAFDKVNSLQFIRNQVGCHFNVPGMEIPDSDVRDFGSATIELVAAITCPNCGALPTKTATDGTYLRCSCSKKAVRMTPVTI